MFLWMRERREKDVNHNSTPESAITERRLQPGSGSEQRWLATMLRRLEIHCEQRVFAADIQLFKVSLHHIFLSTSKLYQDILPRVTTTIQSMHLPVRGSEELKRKRKIWSNLLVGQRQLERLATLFQLLNSAINGMIDSLDATADTSHAREEQGISPGSERFQSPPESRWQPEIQEQWRRAFAIVSTHIKSWKSYRGTLSAYAFHLQSMPPGLDRLDSLFRELLESTCAIYGDILADFQAVLAEDDEMVMTLLLDMMQKADQAIFIIDALMEPLQALIAHHALKQEMN